MKKIGIIGSRRRTSEHDFLCCVDRFLEVYEDGDIIVSGGCKDGGDYFAEIIAEGYGIKDSMIIHYPNWALHGKGAGFVRNTLIAQDSDVLIAMVTKNLSLSKGTMDTVKKFESKGLKAILDSNQIFNPEDF